MLTYLGEGKEGICYLLPNGKVCKIFKEPKSNYEYENCKYVLQYQTETFYFPYKFIKIGHKFIGDISNYAKGNQLSKGIAPYDLETFARGTIQLFKDMCLVSDAKIIMKDIHSGNILYDGKKFRIIDTDQYHIGYDQEEVLYTNYRNLAKLIVDIFIDELRKYGVLTDVLIRRIRKYYFEEIDYNQMIMEIKNIIIEELGIDIKKIEDVKQLVKQTPK